MKSVRLLAALLLSGFPAAAQAAVYYPSSVQYVQTYPTGGTISRAEFVQMAMQSTGNLYADGTNCFTDVRNQPYARYVCAAKQQGIITGYPNGAYRPNNAITYIEAAAIVVRAQGIHVGYSNPWYSAYLDQLSQWDAIPTSVYNILEPISYAQAGELISAVTNRDFDNDMDDDNDNDNDDNDDDTDSSDDLKVTLTSSDNSPEPGDRVTFRIKLENTSDDDIENIDVTAELDNDMDYVSSSDDGDEDDDEVQWDNIDIDEDETKTLVLTVEVDDDLDDGDTIKLRVKTEDGDDLVVTKQLKIDDEDDDDDGDLSITISDSDDEVEPGDEITYTIRLKNEDNDDIRVDVTAFLDEDTDFVSASDGGDESRDEVEWDDIRIDEDETKTLTLRVKVKGSADDGDTLELTVEANEEEETEETDVEDDDDDDDTGDEDIDVSITESKDPVQEGDTVTYRIVLENNDNDDVEVDVRAELDEGMSFLSASHDGRLDGDDEVEWSNLEIEEDEERIILVTVRINNKVDDGDTLRLKVSAGDGEDEETTRVDD